MKKFLSVLGGAVIAFTAVFGATTFAQDATATGYLVSPVRVELNLDKGQSQTVTLTVENPTSIETTAQAVINAFEASSDETGQPKILLDNSNPPSNDFKSLVSAIPDVTLAPHEKKDIPVTITVPNNASAGGYYGAIRFVAAQGDNEKNVALSASVGTIFLVRVSGDLVEDLQLVEFTAAKNGDTGRIFIGSGEMSIVTRLKNTGNIHVKPFGRIQVTDRSGKIVQEYEFNSTDPRANVLPSSTRKFTDVLTPQKWVGKYTITANLGYGTGGNLITAKNTFWVIPIWFVIALAGLIVILVAVGWLIYRRISASRRRLHYRR